MANDNNMLIIGGLIAAVLGIFGLKFLAENKSSTQINTGSNIASFTPQPPASSSGSCSKCPFGG